MDEILRIEGLSKTFTLSRKQQRLERTHERRKVAVDDLTLTANRGEIFGLLGPNGAGKTTTLRMLATLIKPDRGDAIVDGCSIVSQPEEVRGKIAFLTSELKLEDFFTPNYLFDFFSELHGIDPATAAARKKAMFDRFGEGLEITRLNKDFCRCRVEVQISPPFWGWLLQYHGDLHVVEPEALNEEYRTILRQALGEE